MKNSNRHSTIIGFSGKLNGGKDFSALLAQHLIAEQLLDQEIDIYNFISSRTEEEREKLTNFKSVAFADKLKEMCAVATSTPVASWHDPIVTGKHRPFGLTDSG